MAADVIRIYRSRAYIRAERDSHIRAVRSIRWFDVVGLGMARSERPIALGQRWPALRAHFAVDGRAISFAAHCLSARGRNDTLLFSCGRMPSAVLTPAASVRPLLMAAVAGGACDIAVC